MNKLIIGIATCRRPDILAVTLADIARQTRQPDAILLSPIDAEKDIDLTNVEHELLARIRVVSGPAGSSAQRNTIIEQLQKDDIVLFLDDDFMMHPTYCEHLCELFDKNPEIGGHSGRIVADGVNTGGIEPQEALKLLADAQVPEKATIRPHGTTYGCNMAFRASVVLDNNVRFDEQLPLYGWFEDLDFSARLHQYATVINSDVCQGVHLGTKAGRSPGLRLGYSQVINPIYLARKGSMPWGKAIKNILKRLAANTIRSAFPEPWVDRYGRLKGNLLAIYEIVIGKAHPTRILEIKNG